MRQTRNHVDVVGATTHRWTRLSMLLGLLLWLSVPVLAAPFVPTDPACPLTFDTAAGSSHSLVSVAGWSLIFDEGALAPTDEGALSLVPGGRDRGDSFTSAVRLAGGNHRIALDDVQHAISRAHVWDPRNFLTALTGRVADWSPLVFSDDSRTFGSPSSDRLVRGGGTLRVFVDTPNRLTYRAPRGPAVESLLPSRPGRRTPSGGGEGFSLDLGPGGTVALLDTTQTIPAPPAALLTLLGVGAWLARRRMQRG